MHADYADLRARIPEEPTWWDVFGVPRWGEPPPDVAAFMARIKCQNCQAIFRICLVDEVYKCLYGEMLGLRVKGPCPHDPNERHLAIQGTRMHALNPELGEWVDRPLPPDWHYGDPPYHDCVGDTMNSIPEYEWAAYDMEE